MTQLDSSAQRTASVAPFELAVVEAAVEPVEGHQLRMASLLHDAPVPHHEDDVGVHDGRQAVRDDERRPPAHQMVHRILYPALGYGVHRAGCLVEDEQRRVLGDGYLLPLARGQR